MTGPQLQSIFGLLSTYMSFTTISSSPGISAAQRSHVGAHGRQGAAEIGFEMLAIHGRVFPAENGALVTIQQRIRLAWRAIGRVPTTRDGSYVAWLPKAGSYRALYRYVAGPAVRVS